MAVLPSPTTGNENNGSNRHNVMLLVPTWETNHIVMSLLHTVQSSREISVGNKCLPRTEIFSKRRKIYSSTAWKACTWARTWQFHTTSTSLAVSQPLLNSSLFLHCNPWKSGEKMNNQMHAICLRIKIKPWCWWGFWWGRKWEKGLAYSTKYSQAVTHPSTNLAQCCLTSVIRRELVLSAWYGRRQLPWLWNLIIPLFGDKLSSSSGLWFQF